MTEARISAKWTIILMYVKLQITFLDVLQQQNRLTEFLEEQQLQNVLPSPTLTTLSGNLLEYS